jgi:site-specific DNA recombinase
MSKNNGKLLRFAALIRVSTEQQEKQGESLATQRKQNLRDVERLGGTVAEWYGGQEHATPKWEKREVDRLIADAGKGKFDAVIVAYADRWSRDNVKSKEGLEAFRGDGIRFYIGATEMDLFDPTHCLLLGVSAEIGEFLARQSAKKSYENRIELAKRGLPAVKLPSGRTFDREKGTYGLDPDYATAIADIARRYLAGEKLAGVCKAKGMNHSRVCHVLRHECGPVWVQSFNNPSLNIREEIPTAVPELLDEVTIRAVQDRLTAKRTRLHGDPKHEYVLNGYIFCAGCGRNLTGQPGTPGGRGRHYRHGYDNDCPLRPRPAPGADDIERAVLSDLFELFGNPEAIERAVKAAVPDCEKERKRQERLKADLKKVGLAQERVVNSIAEGVITQEQAAKKMNELNEREATLRAELATLATVLANVPTEAELRGYVERFPSGPNLYGAPRFDGSEGEAIVVINADCEDTIGGNEINTWLHLMGEKGGPDRRALVESYFGAPLPDGTPAGVYITPAGGAYRGPKSYTYTLQGRLAWRVEPRSIGPSAGRSPAAPRWRPRPCSAGCPSG